MASSNSFCTVIGIGNPNRGDDAAGRQVTQLLRGKKLKGVEISETNGEAAELIAMLSAANAAFLIVACVSGAKPGTIRRIDAVTTSLEQGAFGLSTHGLGPAEAIELGRALGGLPPCCNVYAVEGGSFEIGARLSPLVARAVTDLIERLCGEIADMREAERKFACTNPP